MRAAVSAGVAATIQISCSRKRSMNSGVLTACRTSRWSSDMISSDVSPGANKMKSVVNSKPGYPDSATVGTSGASGERCAVETASARSRPAAACGSSPDVEPNATLNWPARKSATIAAAPRYGTGTVSNPASIRKSPHHKWGRRPCPAMSIRYRALLLRPGHELGQVVHRQGRVDEQRLGTVVDDGDGLQIESQILVEMRIDGERRT